MARKSFRNKRDVLSRELGRNTRLVALETLRLDGGTQPRVALDEDTVTEYASRMRWDASDQHVVDPEGQRFDALTVFEDGDTLWLADGFHRVEAARRAGLSQLQCQIHQGNQREAVLFSLGANARHGKRRTNADKRRAVARMLQDEEWRAFSDSKIAQVCRVSHPFVGKLRRELEEQGAVQPTTHRVGADGSVYDTRAIGTAPARRAPRASWHKTRPAKTKPMLLCAREVADGAWGAVADEAIASLSSKGLLLVPQTRALHEAVTELNARGLMYMGATLIAGSELVQIWSLGHVVEPPTRATSVEVLAASLIPHQDILEVTL